MSLVRLWSALLALPLLLVLFTVTRPGTYPAAALPPAFDGATAVQLARELAAEQPNRLPGSGGAQGAARWYREKLALYGLGAREDRWREDVPGLGSTELVNLVTVVPGENEQTIVIVAHRDNKGTSPGANDNASGTAALIELARAYARSGTIPRRPTPQHTLVFVSSDAGSFGGLGADRFARTSPLARQAVAVISLDGLAGQLAPRLEITAYVPSSPAPAFVRTLAVRVGEQTGASPALPDWLTQLVALGLPFGYGEQARFLATQRSAVRLSTSPDADSGQPDDAAGMNTRRLGELGRAVETTLASLDGRIRVATATRGSLHLGNRTVSGWALQLLLVTALVPFGVAVVDLLTRSLRRGLVLTGAWRVLRIRIAASLGLGALAFAGALAGIFPRDTNGPPPPDAPPIDSWPVAGLVLLGAVAALGLIRARRRLAPSIFVSSDEALAGYVVTLTVLGAVGLAVAAVNPYALIFVLPSLYAWLLLPQASGRQAWRSDVLYGIGLAGPILALVALESQLHLGPRTLLYAVGLATSGVVPWADSLAFLVWIAAAAQIGALVSGRYAPARGQTSGR
jgi:hypothetical protein